MKKTIGFVALIFALCSAAPLMAQSAADLFQQALRKERVDGDLKAAIAMYRRLIQEHPSDRAVVARALNQLGSAYEKMGNSEARAAYERVVRDFSEQSGEASLARTRLAALRGNSKVALSTETTMRRVWAGSDVDILGVPTPDGRMLTFVDWATGDLAVRDLTTGENRRLTNKGSWETSAAFALSSVPSPDGKTVAYAWFDDKQISINLMPIGGGSARTIYSSDVVNYAQPWDWTADGRAVLTSIHSKDGKSQIVMLGVSDSSVRIQKHLGALHPAKISLSPDGRFVAYDYAAAGGAQQHDIFVYSVDNGTEATVVRDPSQDLLLGWTPDGSGLLFSSDRTGNMSLWMLPISGGIAGGDPQLLRRDAEFTMTPMTITKGGAFYYGTTVSPTDLFVADISAKGTIGKPKRLVERYVGQNRYADWSPDGSSIVYVSQRQPGISSRVLVVRSIVDGSERIISTSVALQGWSSPHFWPDGKSLVVRATDEKGRGGIFRIDPATGAATFLLEPGNGQFAGVIDGGKALVFLHRSVGKAMLVRHSIVDSSQADIYGFSGKKGHNMWTPSISADGKFIGFVQLEPGLIGSLMVVPVSGGEARQITRAAPGYEFRELTWSPDGKYIYYTQNPVTSDGHGGLTSEGDRMPVMRIAVASGVPEATGIVADEIRGIHLSPDGKSISYTAGITKSEVWVMENFLPKAAKRTAARTK